MTVTVTRAPEAASRSAPCPAAARAATEPDSHGEPEGQGPDRELWAPAGPCRAAAGPGPGSRAGPRRHHNGACFPRDQRLPSPGPGPGPGPDAAP